MKFAFLFGNIIQLVIWLVLYYNRKDLRKQILFNSVLFGFFSLLSAYLWWTVDWWHPQNITGTRIGIEDFLIGFSSGGIASIIFEEIFKKNTYRIRKQHGSFKLFFVLIFITLLSISVSFWIFNFSSFVSFVITGILIGCLIIYERKDLAFDAFISGLLTTIAFLPFYYSIMATFPDWINQTYYWSNLSGIKITGIPIEEMVFYFLFGFCVGPSYEFWQKLKERKLK